MAKITNRSQAYERRKTNAGASKPISTVTRKDNVQSTPASTANANKQSGLFGTTSNANATGQKKSLLDTYKQSLKSLNGGSMTSGPVAKNAPAPMKSWDKRHDDNFFATDKGYNDHIKKDMDKFTVKDWIDEVDYGARGLAFAHTNKSYDSDYNTMVKSGILPEDKVNENGTLNTGMGITDLMGIGTRKNQVYDVNQAARAGMDNAFLNAMDQAHTENDFLKMITDIDQRILDSRREGSTKYAQIMDEYRTQLVNEGIKRGYKSMAGFARMDAYNDYYGAKKEPAATETDNNVETLGNKYDVAAVQRAETALENGEDLSMYVRNNPDVMQSISRYIDRDAMERDPRAAYRDAISAAYADISGTYDADGNVRGQTDPVTEFYDEDRARLDYKLGSIDQRMADHEQWDEYSAVLSNVDGMNAARQFKANVAPYSANEAETSFNPGAIGSNAPTTDQMVLDPMSIVNMPNMGFRERYNAAILSHMNDQQKDVYWAFRAEDSANGTDKAGEYMEWLQRTQLEPAYAETEYKQLSEEWGDMPAATKVMANVATVPIQFAGQIGSAIGSFNENYTDTDWTNRGQRIAESYRNLTKEDIAAADSKLMENASPKMQAFLNFISNGKGLLSSAYDIGMNTADNMFRAAATAGVGLGTEVVGRTAAGIVNNAIMAAGSYGSSMYQGYEKVKSGEWSMSELRARAVMDGANEVIQETALGNFEWNLDNAMVTDVKSFIKYNAKTFGNEFLEEFAGAEIDNAVDLVLSKLYGHDSEIESNIMALSNAGYTVPEAIAIAVFDGVVKEPAFSGIEGGISGVGSSASTGAVNAIKGEMQYKKTGAQIAELGQENIAQTIKQGLLSKDPAMVDRANKLYELYQKYGGGEIDTKASAEMEVLARQIATGNKTGDEYQKTVDDAIAAASEANDAVTALENEAQNAEGAARVEAESRLADARRVASQKTQDMRDAVEAMQKFKLEQGRARIDAQDAQVRKAGGAEKLTQEQIAQERARADAKIDSYSGKETQTGEQSADNNGPSITEIFGKGKTAKQLGILYNGVMKALGSDVAGKAFEDAKTAVKAALAKVGAQYSDTVVDAVARMAANTYENELDAQEDYRVLEAAYARDTWRAKNGEASVLGDIMNDVYAAQSGKTNAYSAGNMFSADTREAIAAHAVYQSAPFMKLGVAESAVPASIRRVSRAGTGISTRVSKTGKMAITDETGKTVELKGVTGQFKYENGVMMAEVEGAEGSGIEKTYAPVDNIMAENDDQGAVLKSIASVTNDAGVAQELYSGYTAAANVSGRDFADAIVDSYMFGRNGANQDAIISSISGINVQIRDAMRAAYDSGKASLAQRNKSQAATKSGGKFSVDKSVNRAKLSEHQRAEMKVLAAIAKTGGVNIEVFESKAGEDGKYKGENGSYNPATNTIRIDVHAGLSSANSGQQSMLRTMAHELTHYIQSWNSADYNELMGLISDALVKETGADSFRALVAGRMEQINPYKTVNGRQVEKSYQELFDEAMDEVIADGCEMMLQDNRFIEQIANQNKTLGQKILDFINKILDGIRDAMNGIDPKSREAKLLARNEETFRKAQEMWSKALMGAMENAQGGVIQQVAEKTDGAVDESGNALMSMRTMEEDIDTYRNMLLDSGMEQGEVDNLFNQIETLMGVIRKNMHILDFGYDMDSSERSFTPVKPNSDPLYKVSVDFSTLCRKRILQQVVQERLEARLNRPITKAERIAVRNELIELQKQGKQIEVACALCYVESARLKSPAQIQKFINDRGNIIKDWFAVNTSDETKQLMKEYEEAERYNLGIDPETSLKALPKKVADKIRAAKKRAISDYKPTAAQQAEIDFAASMTVSDFTSSDALWDLKKNHPELFYAYTTYVRNATKSKGIEGDTPWKAGDSASITDGLIEAMNRENGMRSQSWSDFQIHHILDYIAATIELSTRKAKMQAYTKVPSYVRLMGRTGQMINLSLIPNAKFNGTLEYDGVEGINPEQAAMLREKYADTAGTICIGINDDQIRMLLADDFIDYVIPYHKSSMDKRTRKAMHIPDWVDYEKSQNEKKTDHATGKAPVFSEWFDLNEARAVQQQYMNDHAGEDNAKLNGARYAMQQAANTYLQLCEDRGYLPKFQQFANEANYWKLLIDRKMVNQNTGELIEQKAVKPVFDLNDMIDICNEEVARFEETNKDFNDAADAVVQAFDNGDINKAANSKKVQDQVKAFDDMMAVNTLMAAAGDMASERKSAREDTSTSPYGTGEGKERYSARVTDEKLIEQLNNGETYTTYRSMQLIDGKLYPPMAAVVAGSTEDASELGKWEMAVEHPELIKLDAKGKPQFVLNKGKGKGSLQAAYNPYMHSSNLVINDQFSGAWDRPNLVTVECEVPVSEDNGAYYAEYAKDATGWHSWHTGTVAGAVRRAKGVERQVFLSRYLKPVRILDASEVAGMYKDLLDGTDIEVPDNVVPPALREALIEAGVPVKTTGKVKYSQRDGMYPFTEKTFSEQIDDWIDDQNEPDIAKRKIGWGDSLLLGGTPDVLKQIGLTNLPLTINQDHVRRSLKGTGNADHVYDKEDFKKLPERIAHPIAVITSATHTGTSVVVVIDMKSANKKDSIAAVAVDGYGHLNLKRIDSNGVTTVHGRNNTLRLLKDAVDAESNGNVGVFYWNKKIAISLMQSEGLQLPNGLPNDGYIHSITDSESPVKKRFSSQTETDQFKRWFGDSVVRNTDGTPMVMYHGTMSEFDVFEKGDVGFHFGTEEQSRERTGYSESAIIKPVYLSIQNPLSVAYDIGSWNAKELISYMLGDDPDMFSESFADKYLSDNDFTTKLAEISGMPDEDYNSEGNKALRDLLMSIGYDGIVYTNDYEADGEDSYIAFKSTQVKSAMDNIGTFDVDNPNIRNSSRDYVQDAYPTEQTIDKYLHAYASKHDPKYAQAYIGTMRPDAFLALTTEGAAGEYFIRKQSHELDENEFKDVMGVQPIYLSIDHKTGKVTGHEGRHRMVALERAGITNVPVLFFDSSNKYDKEPINVIDLKGQFSEYLTRSAGNLIPLSYENRDEIIKRFTPTKNQQFMEKHGVKDILRYSQRENKVSDSDILRASGEGVAQTSTEKEYLGLYKEATGKLVELLDKRDERLREIDAMKQEGAKLETLMTKRGLVKLLNERIETAQKKVNALEKSKPIASVLERVRKETESAVIEAMANHPGVSIDTAIAAQIETYKKEIDRLKKGRVQKVATFRDVPGAQGVLSKEVPQMNRDAFRKESDAAIGSMERKLEALQQKYTKDLAREVERGKNAVQRIRDMRNASDTRQKIRKLIDDFNKRLKNPTMKSYVPMDLTRAIVQAMESFDLSYIRNGEAVVSEKIAAMRDVYDRYNSDSSYSYAYSPFISSQLQSLSTAMAGKRFNQLNGADLQKVYDIMKSMHKQVTEATKIKAGDYAKDIFTAGREMIEEIEGAEKARGFLTDYLNWQLTPDRFFERLAGFKKDSTWSKVAKTFADGEAKFYEIQRDFQEMFQKFSESKEADKLTAHGKDDLVDVGLKHMETGEPVLITRGQMLSVYMHLQNEENRLGFMRGGFVVPSLKDYYGGKIAQSMSAKNGMVRTLGTSQRLANISDQLYAEGNTLSDADREKLQAEKANLEREGEIQLSKVRATIEGMLTDWERRLIAQAHEWNDRHSREYINEVTMDLYGFKRAAVENYYPIHRDTDFVQLDTDANTGKQSISLENVGFLKDRVQSSAPVVLTDILFELDDTSKRVARYAGFVRAQRDFNKLLNVQNGGMRTSVKSAIADKFGKGEKSLGATGEQYINNFIDDIAGSRARVTDSIFAAVRRNLPRATLSLNPRVAFSQLASIPTAAAEVGYLNMTTGFLKSFTRAFSTKYKNELAHKDVWFWQRYRGEGGMSEFADAKAGGNAIDRAYRWVDKKTHGALLNWCQKFDVYATTTMYTMAEDWVKRNKSDLAVGSWEYEDAVSEKYAAILRKTQPMYTTTARSDMLRGTNEVMKMFQMYKTQSNQNLNIMYEAVQRYRKYAKDAKNGINGVTNGDVVKARGDMVRSTITVGFVASATFAILKFMVDAMMLNLKRYKDWDTGELTIESTMDQIVKTAMSSVAGVTALGGDLYDILSARIAGTKYYGFSDSGISEIATMCTTLASEDWSKEETWMTMGDSLFKVLGLPKDNLMKLVNAGSGYVKKVRGIGEDVTDKQMYARLYKASIAGDEEAWSKIVSDMMTAKGGNEKKAENTILSGYEKYVGTLFKAGKIDLETALKLIRNDTMGPGRSEDDAFWITDKWQFEKDHKGDDVSYAKNERIVSAIQSGTASNVTEAVNFYKEHGFNDSGISTMVKSAVQGMYVDGTMSWPEAEAYVKMYGLNNKKAYDEDGLYWLHQEWDYAAEHGTTDGWSKYSDLDEAMESGNQTAIVQAVNGLMNHGVKKTSVASAIATQYKEEYVRLYKSNPTAAEALLRKSILPAYVAAGYSESKERKYIAKNWFKNK